MPRLGWRWVGRVRTGTSSRTPGCWCWGDRVTLMGCGTPPSCGPYGNKPNGNQLGVLSSPFAKGETEAWRVSYQPRASQLQMGKPVCGTWLMWEGGAQGLHSPPPALTAALSLMGVGQGQGTNPPRRAVEGGSSTHAPTWV